MTQEQLAVGMTVIAKISSEGFMITEGREYKIVPPNLKSFPHNTFSFIDDDGDKRDMLISLFDHYFTTEPPKGGEDQIDIAIRILDSKLKFDSSEYGHAYGTIKNHITALQSRVKELEGELSKVQSSILDVTHKAIELKKNNELLEAVNQQLTAEVERLKGLSSVSLNCEFCDETYRVQQHCLCEKCRKILGD